MAYLARSRVCLGTVSSVVSIRSVSRVGHGVGQRIFPFRIYAAINKKRASCPNFREKKMPHFHLRLSPLTAGQDFWGHQFTHPWVGQAEHLACRKRQPGALAGVARTHSGRGGRCPQKAPVAAVSALCAAFVRGAGQTTGCADLSNIPI